MALGNMLLLLTFFGLDVRDLYFKIAWLGPYDSYAFSAIGGVHADANLLTPVSALPNPGHVLSRPSGWTSFLQQCDGLQGSGFFLDVVGKNCSVGDPRQPKAVENLLMSSSLRVDAVAWACCKLLRFDRRPLVCQERMIKGFLKRYKIKDVHVPTDRIARVDSSAERELLALLGVVGRSSPSFRIICVQAFEYVGKGEYLPTIFGCGNPSAYESAFAGFSAHYLRDLLRDKAWLTCDVLSVMGLQFVMRQNDMSFYAMNDPKDGVVTGEHRTSINFSASGQLYALVITIDIFLMGLNLLSAVEIFDKVLLPVLKTGKSQDGDQVRGDTSCFSIFSRSLYRCRPVVVLTTLTQLISWQIILPNAVVWTWTSSTRGKLLAYMSSIRVWVLLLISLIALWDVVVVVLEKCAYAFVRHTFITTAELMVVGAVVAFVNRADLFSMGEKKYRLEHQRFVDSLSFKFGNLGFANVYNDDLNGIGLGHGQLSTSMDVLTIVYAPLFRILYRSILSILGFLILKMGYLYWRRQHGDGQVALMSQPYKRLPTETLLGIAIRAKGIIRSSYELEVESSGSLYVPAALLFDFGVLLDREAEVVGSRVGFLGDVVPPSIMLGDDSACAVTDLAKGGNALAQGPTLSFTMNPLAHRKSFVAWTAKL